MKKLFSFFWKKKPSETITVVSGLPRSGTSMMMKVLEAGGIHPLIDKKRAADEDNPKGYYEFERVKGLDKGDCEWVSEAEGKVVKVITALLTHLPGKYTYRVVFMQRNMEEVLASQKKMLVNRNESTDQIDDEEMSRLYNGHLQQVENWIKLQSNIYCLYVDYNAILKEANSNLREINEFFGDTLDFEKMCAVVDPDLYRQRK